MKYISILGEPLKSVFLIDLFETYDVDVIYEYDRVFEGAEDEYRAAIPEIGLEFIFDASQQLMTLFMNKVEHSGYNPFEGEDPRSASFSSAKEAMKHAEVNGIRVEHREASTDSFLGDIPEWVKFFFVGHSLHYSFNAAGVNKVTLQKQPA